MAQQEMESKLDRDARPSSPKPKDLGMELRLSVKLPDEEKNSKRLPIAFITPLSASSLDSQSV